MVVLIIMEVFLTFVLIVSTVASDLSQDYYPYFSYGKLLPNKEHPMKYSSEGPWLNSIKDYSSQGPGSEWPDPGAQHGRNTKNRGSYDPFKNSLRFNNRHRETGYEGYYYPQDSNQGYYQGPNYNLFLLFSKSGAFIENHYHPLFEIIGYPEDSSTFYPRDVYPGDHSTSYPHDGYSEDSLQFYDRYVYPEDGSTLYPHDGSPEDSSTFYDRYVYPEDDSTLYPHDGYAEDSSKFYDRYVYPEDDSTLYPHYGSPEDSSTFYDRDVYPEDDSRLYPHDGYPEDSSTFYDRDEYPEDDSTLYPHDGYLEDEYRDYYPPFNFNNHNGYPEQKSIFYPGCEGKEIISEPNYPEDGFAKNGIARRESKKLCKNKKRFSKIQLRQSDDTTEKTQQHSTTTDEPLTFPSAATSNLYKIFTSTIKTPESTKQTSKEEAESISQATPKLSSEQPPKRAPHRVLKRTMDESPIYSTNIPDTQSKKFNKSQSLNLKDNTNRQAKPTLKEDPSTNFNKKYKKLLPMLVNSLTTTTNSPPKDAKSSEKK